jgi:hypothetical protein
MGEGDEAPKEGGDGDKKADAPKDAKEEAKAEVKEAEGPNAEELVKENKEVLKTKKINVDDEMTRQMKNARDADAASAADIAKFDALGKEIIQHGYDSRAAAKVAAAKAAIDANVAMHDV